MPTEPLTKEELDALEQKVNALQASDGTLLGPETTALFAAAREGNALRLRVAELEAKMAATVPEGE